MKGVWQEFEGEWLAPPLGLLGSNTEHARVDGLWLVDEDIFCSSFLFLGRRLDHLLTHTDRLIAQMTPE